MFPRGVGAYVDLMVDLIPEMKDGTVRTAIDTGCGVSFILYLQPPPLLFFYFLSLSLSLYFGHFGNQRSIDGLLSSCFLLS